MVTRANFIKDSCSDESDSFLSCYKQDPIWLEDVQFVPYTPPPLQFHPAIADHASLEEWTEKIIFISEDLKMLLSLPHSKFWCQVFKQHLIHVFMQGKLLL